MNKYYAGIGSRKTPPDICQLMTQIAEELSQGGYILRSGHARMQGILPTSTEVTMFKQIRDFIKSDSSARKDAVLFFVLVPIMALEAIAFVVIFSTTR